MKAEHASIGGDADFIAQLIDEMRRRNSTQTDVAEAIGLSQAHVSRLLSGKFHLTRKSKAKLQAWMSRDEEATVDQRIRVLTESILASRPQRKKALLPLILAFEAIIRE